MKTANLTNQLNDTILGAKIKLMKRSLLFIWTAIFITLLTGNVCTAASYQTVWGYPSGVLDFSFTGWDPYYIDQPDYRVAQLNFSLANNTGNTYYDVTMVLPFVWEDFTPAASPPKQASGWDNANQEWINDYVGYGNVDGNGLYVKVYADPLSPSYSYLLMSQTDIPTSRSYSGYETATVATTDSVPAWALATIFAPSDSTSFSIFLEYERKNDANPPSLSSLWIDPFVVSSVVPIPGAVWLFASGLIGLAGYRKKFRKN